MTGVYTTVNKITGNNKRCAVAGQTTWCRSKVLSIQYVYLGPTKGSGREDKTFAESQKTRSQASCQKHWLFCVSK